MLVCRLETNTYTQLDYRVDFNQIGNVEEILALFQNGVFKCLVKLGFFVVDINMCRYAGFMIGVVNICVGVAVNRDYDLAIKR